MQLGCLRVAGGKLKQTARIARMFPSGRFRQYREPFAGGAAVLFYVRQAGLADGYWLNDLFKPTATFWQCVQDVEKCQAMTAFLRRVIAKRQTLEDAYKMFNYFRNSDPETIEGIGSRFFVLNRCSFSGSTLSGGMSKSAPFNRFTPSSIDRIERLTPYLQGVTITNLDYSELMDDEPGDFMFCDPPYFAARKLYGKNGDCHDIDYAQLSDCLKSLRGDFLMTIDNSPEIRRLFSWANIEPWDIRYSMTVERSIVKELFVSNYDYLNQSEAEP